MKTSAKILLPLLAAFLSAALTGCDLPPPDKRVEMVKTPETQTGNRFTITRVALFSDNVAYNGQRGIYVIKDEKTGTEYVGVSGIGIAEIGAHPAGKATHGDER